MARLGNRTGASSDGPQYEARLQLAIQGIKNGTYRSIAQAAREFKVVRQTLQDRVSGKHQTRREAMMSQQLLTPQQENVLLDWCDHLLQSAMPLDPKTLREYAYSLTGKRPGKNWCNRFIKRHPNLQGAQTFSKPTFEAFYEKRETLESQNSGIPPQNDWVMDEKQIQMGGGRSHNQAKFYFTREQKSRPRIRSDYLEVATVIECIAAAGQTTPPGFVLQNGPIPDCSKVDGIGCVATSPVGRSDSEIILLWFKNVFVPHAILLRDPSKPIVLTFASRGIHETDELKQLAHDHNVILFGLSSRTAYKLEPLNVAVFSPVESAWEKHCSDRLTEEVNINRYNVLDEYMRVRKVMTHDLIRNSFAATGMHPFNRAILANEDNAPGGTSSTTAHFPLTVPTENLAPPLLAPSDSGSADEDERDHTPDSGTETNDDSSPPNPSNGSPRHVSNLPAPILPDEAEPDNMEADGNVDVSPVDRPSSRARSSSVPRPPNAILSEINGFRAVVSQEQDERLSYPETMGELRRLRLQTAALQKAVVDSQGSLDAANAGLAAARREANQLRIQLAHLNQEQGQSSIKIQSRFVTHADLKALFEAEKAARKARERPEADNDAQQVPQDAGDSRVFSGSLSTYTRKSELMDLAGALGVSQEGTVADLKTRIRKFLDASPQLSQNPRFSALFPSREQGRRRPDPRSTVAALATSGIVSGLSSSAPTLCAAGRSASASTVPQAQSVVPPPAVHPVRPYIVFQTAPPVAGPSQLRQDQSINPMAVPPVHGPSSYQTLYHNPYFTNAWPHLPHYPPSS